MQKQVKSKHSKRKQLLKKMQALCWSTQATNRTTSMNTRKPFKSWKLAVLLTLPALQACSTPSAPLPPSTHKLQVTPLPAEISQISTSDSQSLLDEARALLADLWDWSNGETRK
jgi:hypothetical protein